MSQKRKALDSPRKFRRPEKMTRPLAQSSLKANQLQILRARPDEVKVYDASVVDIANVTGVVINPLVTQAFAQGTAQRNEFIGRFLTPIGLDLRFHVVGPAQASGATVPDLFDNVRVVVFQFLDSDVPTVAGVLQTSSHLSPLNLTNYNNINVLMDRLFPLYPTAIDSDSNACMYNNYSERVYIKGKKMVPIEMNTDGASNTFQKGGIYWCQIGNSTVAPHAAVQVHMRLSFKDS